MQREIRQRCGFGCVVCGLPLFEYDHLLGWAAVQRHVAEEITILCDQHHRERGSGLLPIATVEEANKAPFNLRQGVSNPYDLHYAGTECEIVLGGNTFGAQDAGYGTILVPIWVDGIPLLAFILGDGHLLLNLNLFDEFNDLVLQIRNNQLTQSVSPWDIRLVGRNLVIREAARKILVDITFEPPSRIVINRGRFLRNGVEILIRPDRVVLANNGMLFAGQTVQNLPVGLVIGPSHPGASTLIHAPQVPRYRHDKRLVDAWIAEEFDATDGTSG
jgi:trigger factor